MGTWTMATTSVMPAEPTRADWRLARHAAALVVAAKASDLAGVDRVLKNVEPHQVARLFMLFATSANADVILKAAGCGDITHLREMHRRYYRLWRRGLRTADMPPEVVEGQRMYARLNRRARVARGTTA